MTNFWIRTMAVTTRTALCLAILFSVTATLVGQLTPFDRDSVKLRDNVKLRSGVRIYGEVISKGTDDDGRAFTIFTTESQTILKLDNRFIVGTHVLDADDGIYNDKVSIMDDTAEHHWSAIQWCDKQTSGSIRFKDQIDFHLNRIMLLDPNDTRVRHRLNYDYLEAQDRWVPHKLYWTSLGYRSQGKAWVPILQDEVNQFSGSRNSDLGERKSKFSIWKGRVRVGKLSNTQLANDLFLICDALAVPMIFEAAKKESSPVIRAMYVEAIGKIASSAAAQALVSFSVEDPASANRDRALDLLLQEHYDPAFVAGHLARFFNPNKYSNATLQRAAFNIGEVNNRHSILPLVGVLSTKHVVAPADDPGRINSTFNGNGDLQGFSTGGSGKAKTIVVKNSKVLGALRKISGEDHGFDPDQWKKWYIENHTLTDVNVRGDF